MVLTLSNGLSFFRAPLAFLFLQSNPVLRFTAVFLAMVTDSIDGHVARRSQSASQFGAVLDPAMDKFFVYFALTTLYQENTISLFAAIAMIARDVSVFVFTLLLVVTKRWGELRLRPIRWGKLTTALQFVTLMALIAGVQFPWYLYISFILMGGMAFRELLLQKPAHFLSTSNP